MSPGSTFAPGADGFRHEALLYAGDDGFVDAVLGPVRAGLAADGAVMAVLPPPRLAALRAALGPADAERVRLADMHEEGRNPGRLIALWRGFVADHAPAGRPVVGIGEPVWPGRSAEELVECERHECLLNRAFDGGPAWWLGCSYDTHGLCAEALVVAGHAHPVVREHGRAREAAGTGVHGPLPAHPLDPPPPGATSAAFDAGDLTKLRDLVAARADAAGLGARGADLVLATHELLTNTVRHAGGIGTLRTWEQDGALVVEVADGGHLPDPLVGGTRPRATQLGGRGLWMVHELCDLVQLRSSSAGTVVRVRVATGPGSGLPARAA